MRVARLSPAGYIEEVLREDMCPLSAEIAAHEVAVRQPGVLFAVLPDDADELLCVAHYRPWSRLVAA